MSSLVVTHQSTVDPDQIDDLGHMNVRYYGMNASAATQAICERLGLPRPTILSTYTRHHHEQMEGNELEVRSAIIPGGSRLRIYHELRNRGDDDLAATFVHELEHPAIDAPMFEVPHYGAPRSLDLDTDALATAPSLAQVRDLGLANRKPRLIDLDDTLGADTVPATNYGSVLWGGERMEDEASWVRVLPDGTRYAFVVMEQRVWFRHTPVALGTPVQTFRASLEAGEKIGRDIAWSFNTETGEPIVASETIDLCFNLTERRSMALPAEIRAQEDGGYHPEFAPGLKAVR